MTKEVQIGGEKVLFGASGALPILYRELTGRELFADNKLIYEGTSQSLIFDLAWVMYRDGNPDSVIEEKEWLKQFNFMDLNNALGEIIELYASSQVTTSKAKKEVAR